MTSDQWQRHLAQRQTLKARFTPLQLIARVRELDKELCATGSTTLSHTRKRARLAREITASMFAWVEATKSTANEEL
jgi:hypothetical protein